MHNSTNDVFTSWLWYATIATQPLLLFAIYWRKAHKKHPWFPRYILIDFAASLFLLSVHNYSEYVASFYLLAIVTACCKVAILAGIVGQVFAPYENLRRGTMTKLFIGLIATIGIFSGLIFSNRSGNLDNSMNFLRMCDSALSAAICCGFWVVVIYARKLGLYWRSHTAGIAVGFLFHSSVQTATKLVLSHAHPEAAIWVRNVSQLSYLIALFIWIGFMLVPEPVFSPTQKEAEDALALVRHTEDRLRKLKQWRIRLVASSPAARYASLWTAQDQTTMRHD